MSIDIQSTSDVADQRGIKVLVHGQSGAGKTYMASTTTNLDETLIISAEQGLLSLHQYDIDAVEVTTINEFREARNFAQRQNRYSWVILDSISEIAEVILGEEKEQRRDPRQAYGEMADQVTAILRDFRHLPCNVVMTAKQTLEEVNGTKLKRPLLPGNQLTENVAYMFDEVFALELDRTRDGANRRYLQTQRTRDIIAKDRSGALDPDDWQSEHSRFFALLDEADVNDPIASRLRDAIKARHGLDPSDSDAWKRLPAGCLKLWNDAIESENGGRREWAEAFVDAHEPVLPDTDAAAE